MTKLQLSAAITLIASVGAGYAQAQQDAASVKLGKGVEFKPSLNFDVQNDDNLLYSDTNQVESVVAVINPKFELFATNGVSEYSLNYSLTKGEHF